MTQAQCPNPYLRRICECPHLRREVGPCKFGVFASWRMRSEVFIKKGKYTRFRSYQGRGLRKGERNGVELKGASRENGANKSSTVAEAANK